MIHQSKLDSTTPEGFSPKFGRSNMRPTIETKCWLRVSNGIGLNIGSKKEHHRSTSNGSMYPWAPLPNILLPATQRVQTTYMAQRMLSVVRASLMVWIEVTLNSIPKSYTLNLPAQVLRTLWDPEPLNPKPSRSRAEVASMLRELEVLAQEERLRV